VTPLPHKERKEEQMVDIKEQKHQIPMNDPPVDSDPNEIRFPSVNTCITVTFHFTDILVGVHLGLAMGVRDELMRGKDLDMAGTVIQDADIQTYMHAARSLMPGASGRRVRRTTASAVYILGAIQVWQGNLPGPWGYLRDGCKRWARELGVNCYAYSWDDITADTVNIYVRQTDNPVYSFVEYVGGSADIHFANEGAVVNANSVYI
jgi:hypothetical protein